MREKTLLEEFDELHQKIQMLKIEIIKIFKEDVIKIKKILIKIGKNLLN